MIDRIGVHRGVPEACHAAIAGSQLSCIIRLKLLPSSPSWQGWCRLGNCLVRKGRLQDAIHALKRGVELDPDNDAAKSALREATAQQQQQPQQSSSRPEPRSAPPPSSPSFSWPKLDLQHLQYQASLLWYKLVNNKVRAVHAHPPSELAVRFAAASASGLLGFASRRDR